MPLHACIWEFAWAGTAKMPHSGVWDFGAGYQWGASFSSTWPLSFHIVSHYSLRSPNFVQGGRLPNGQR